MSGGGAAGAGGAVARHGHLRKLKTMKKKFFVLRAETSECSARLEYYESEKKFKAGALPRRVLPLKGCYNIMRRLDLKQKHVIALFTREEQFCIVAENEQDLHSWLSAILKQHRVSDEASEELLHPIQHVWQVNVQKKGLGATKNIHGLYNLCLTDKALTLVKIKSQNNVIGDLGIQDRVEYSLKNIRRCGDSECFFYMEVGRQTSTGAGELWMHTEDSNIAQSMHSTILHAMRHCAKESENERDHIVIPKSTEGTLTARRSTYSADGHTWTGLTNDASTVNPRGRCDSMPARTVSHSFEVERPPARMNDLEVMDISRDETDAMAEWYRTPRIPEEPDVCDISRDLFNMSMRPSSSIQHSRTSSMGIEDSCDVYLAMEPTLLPHVPMAPPLPAPAGYLSMTPHEPSGLLSASSGSVCSGTPSTDPRFSEYQLEPATSHIGMECRPPRAYSVGSRPASALAARPERHRAYSVGASARRPPPAAGAVPRHKPQASAEDLMLLDFSAHDHRKSSVPHTPPSGSYMERRNTDEYVDMSPRNAGYVEMRPGEPPLPLPAAPLPLPTAPLPAPSTPDGYVEMNYGARGHTATRPIAIASSRPPPPVASSPDELRRKNRTPLGSQTIFPFSLESPASPDQGVAEITDEEVPSGHPLTTVREISEECAQPAKRSPEVNPDVSCSPQYVQLRPIGSNKTPEPKEEISGNPTANKTIARVEPDARAESRGGAPVVLAGAGGAAPARFSLLSSPLEPAPPAAPPSPSFACTALNYAALDLESARGAAPATPRTYTKIDFVRSEKLHTAGADGT